MYKLRIFKQNMILVNAEWLGAINKKYIRIERTNYTNEIYVDKWWFCGNGTVKIERRD